MMDLLKKTLAFGMGAAAFSAEKFKQFADDMVARGEMTSDEAGKFVDDMTKRAEDEKRTVQEWVREQMSKMLQQVGAVESARVDALEQRITALEERLGVPAQEAKAEAGATGEC
jgi:polyhydroxyalkanoate synthesis regulator phasin